MLLAFLLLLPILLVCIPIRWIADEGHTLCIWTNITGRNCYGCGMTRAVVSAMHLKLADAWHYNRSVVVVMPILAFLWTKWVVDLARKLFFTRNKK